MCRSHAIERCNDRRRGRHDANTLRARSTNTTQIRELLRDRILRWVYKSHAQMPSENEMVRAFGVSRITVRQALTDLQKEGLIFRIHGKGTFVAKPKAIQNLRRLEGFGAAMGGAGHETYSKVPGHRVMRAGKVVWRHEVAS